VESNFYTWTGLLYLLVTLVGFYLIIWLFLQLLENFGRRDLSKRRIIDYLKTGVILYKFFAITILILGFISINYITHSLLLLFIGVFGYHHIKNYISGVFMNMNSSLKKGASIVIGSLEGVIERLLLFGMSISTESGEHYLTYRQIEKSGFTIKSGKDSVLRKTIFVKTDLNPEAVLDVLFDNPILDLKEQPTVGAGEQPGQLKLQYTLEKGSTNQDFMAFLKKNQIEIGSPTTPS
jgi:hypothetical protein